MTEKFFSRMKKKEDGCVIERETENTFDLHSNYEPAGDQPTAICQLSEGVVSGKKAQILLGQ